MCIYCTPMNHKDSNIKVDSDFTATLYYIINETVKNRIHVVWNANARSLLFATYNQCKCAAIRDEGRREREWGETSCWYNVLTQRLRQVLSWLQEWVEIVRACGSNSVKWGSPQGCEVLRPVIRVTETINWCFHRSVARGGWCFPENGRLSQIPNLHQNRKFPIVSLVVLG